MLIASNRLWAPSVRAGIDGAVPRPGARGQQPFAARASGGGRVGDERRVAEPEACRGRLKAPRRGDPIPAPAFDAVLDRQHAWPINPGGSEVAVVLARDVGLPQTAARTRAPHRVRVGVRADRHELVGDGVEVQLRYLEPAAGTEVCASHLSGTAVFLRGSRPRSGF